MRKQNFNRFEMIFNLFFHKATFNKSLDFRHFVANSDLMKAGVLMVNCQSLANYNICTCKYIEHIRNDTCLTSSRDVHVHVFQLK